MITNNNSINTDLKCIWMTSGLIKYKLCDREFDCENCEFDKVIRNLSTGNQVSCEKNNTAETESEDPLKRLIKRIEQENYDNKIIYLKNQLVIKNLFGNAYYLGINPAVLFMLDDFDLINEFHSSEIKQNQIILSLEGSWGIKQFISPINFMIIEKINFYQFKLNQWYAVILFNEGDIDDFRYTETEWINEKNRLINILKSYIPLKPQIGTSLMDGGEKIKYFHQYLGRDEYINLLNGVFK
jgi:hypothetical protein